MKFASHWQIDLTFKCKHSPNIQKLFVKTFVTGYENLNGRNAKFGSHHARFGDLSCVVDHAK